MQTRERLLLWVSAGGIAAGASVLAESLSLDHVGAGFATALMTVCAFTGTALALNLSWRRLWMAAPAAVAPALYGHLGSLVVWVAGALVLLALLRGDDGAPKSGFISRRMLLRKVMDANFPDEKAHLALKHGFAGSFEELRPAVAPVASLPPAIAIPLLSRLSLCTDSITRLTARKRMELIIAALREETERATPARDARHAALRIRKAETLLVLATRGSSDPDERKARLNEAAALAFVASDDYPGNDAYTALAAGAAARVGERKAAARLHARIRDPRRAWSTGRLIRLCMRLTPEREQPAERPPQIRTTRTIG